MRAANHTRKAAQHIHTAQLLGDLLERSTHALLVGDIHRCGHDLRLGEVFLQSLGSGGRLLAVDIQERKARCAMLQESAGCFESQRAGAAGD